MKEPVLYIANEDFVEGINRGYYDNEIAKIGPSKACFRTYERAVEENLIGQGELRSEEAMYVFNKYKNMYVPFDSGKNDEQMVLDKTLAIREVLVYLGAKTIRYVEEITDKESREMQVDGGIRGVVGGGEARFKNEKSLSMNIKSNVESSDHNRRPKSIDQIQKIMANYGLSDDSNLKLLFERLKADPNRRLYGKEVVNVTYHSELKSAFDVVAELSKSMVFNANINLNYNSFKEHIFSYTLEVNFDE